jgi:hypothetical protein
MAAASARRCGSTSTSRWRRALACSRPRWRRHSWRPRWTLPITCVRPRALAGVPTACNNINHTSYTQQVHTLCVCANPPHLPCAQELRITKRQLEMAFEALALARIDRTDADVCKAYRLMARALLCGGTGVPE